MSGVAEYLRSQSPNIGGDLQGAFSRAEKSGASISTQRRWSAVVGHDHAFTDAFCPVESDSTMVKV